MFRKFLCLAASLSLASCASLRSVSLTQIPAQRSKPVSTSVDKFIFLAFSFDNDFVDTLTEKLREQCPQGQIQGILTKDEVRNYFFAHTRKVTATGYCIQ